MTEAPWCLFVSGSRDLRREHLKLVRDKIEPFATPRCGVLIHGDGEGRNGSIGCDRLAQMAAEHWGLRIIAIPADWDRLGKKAGPLRNRVCAEVLLAHRIASYRLAFLAFSTGGPGTEGAHKIVQDLYHPDRKPMVSTPIHIEKFQITL